VENSTSWHFVSCTKLFKYCIKLPSGYVSSVLAMNSNVSKTLCGPSKDCKVLELATSALFQGPSQPWAEILVFVSTFLEEARYPAVGQFLLERFQCFPREIQASQARDWWGLESINEKKCESARHWENPTQSSDGDSDINGTLFPIRVPTCARQRSSWWEWSRFILTAILWDKTLACFTQMHEKP
jgi:hypothetical protein